jgi:hypothetical protein
MRKNGEQYEYIAVYVDDLLFAMADPETFVKTLSDKKGRYKFKLKGTGPISFHLGCNFARDEDGVMTMAPKKYIQKLIDGYVRMFRKKPQNEYHSSLEEGDHPELDTSEMLKVEGVTTYQSLIGSMQWTISLGRIDIATVVMSLSSFRSAP